MVRCQDCGFLTVRHDQRPDFHEADRDYRETGVPQGPLNGCRSGPLCFVMAHDLRAELMATRDAPEPQRSLAIVARDRECDRHCRWLQGFAPKEHREMVHEDELRRLQGEAKRADRDWQEQQKQSDRDWQRRQKWNDRVWNVAVGVVAFLTGYAFNEAFKPR